MATVSAAHAAVVTEKGLDGTDWLLRLSSIFASSGISSSAVDSLPRAATVVRVIRKLSSHTPLPFTPDSELVRVYADRVANSMIALPAKWL